MASRPPPRMRSERRVPDAHDGPARPDRCALTRHTAPGCPSAACAGLRKADARPTQAQVPCHRTWQECTPRQVGGTNSPKSTEHTAVAAAAPLIFRHFRRRRAVGLLRQRRSGLRGRRAGGRPSRGGEDEDESPRRLLRAASGVATRAEVSPGADNAMAGSGTWADGPSPPHLPETGAGPRAVGAKREGLLHRRLRQPSSGLLFPAVLHLARFCLFLPAFPDLLVPVCPGSTSLASVWSVLCACWPCPGPAHRQRIRPS